MRRFDILFCDVLRYCNHVMQHVIELLFLALDILDDRALSVSRNDVHLYGLSLAESPTSSHALIILLK